MAAVALVAVLFFFPKVVALAVPAVAGYLAYRALLAHFTHSTVTDSRVESETVSAGFVARAYSTVFDVILVSAAWLPIGFLLAALFPEAVPSVMRAVSSVGFLVLAAAYYTTSWTLTGSTPGKSVMGLKVVRADGGGLLDVSGAIIRYVGYFISFIAVLLGFLWIIWDPKHDGWHDKIAGTKVIKYK